MRTESRELLAVGIFGGKSRRFESRLGHRIEILLRRGRTFSPRASANSVAASAIVLTALLMLASLATRWIAFAQSAIASFEVSSIKPSPHPLIGQGIVFGMPDAPGRFTGYYMTLKDLMTKAYGVEHSQISGGPSWVSSDRYHVTATLPKGAPHEQIPLMLQTLLSERFHLLVRRESRMTRVYALVPARGGSKLKRSGVVQSPSPGLMFGPNGELGLCCGRFALSRVSMERFAALLSSQTDRPVRDAAGIAGEFYISLEWTPDAAGTEPEGAPFPGGPSIYTAVQEQLGLKLEPSSASLEYLVIDHAEKPDAD